MIAECSIETERGVKVAHVAWCSDAFLAKHGFETPHTEAPEVCIAILSPSNRDKEMEEKRPLYFDRGAKEVWVVTEEAEIAYFDSGGRISNSHMDVAISL